MPRPVVVLYIARTLSVSSVNNAWFSRSKCPPAKQIARKLKPWNDSDDQLLNLDPSNMLAGSDNLEIDRDNPMLSKLLTYAYNNQATQQEDEIRVILERFGMPLTNKTDGALLVRYTILLRRLKALYLSNLGPLHHQIRIMIRQRKDCMSRLRATNYPLFLKITEYLDVPYAFENPLIFDEWELDANRKRCIAEKRNNEKVVAEKDQTFFRKLQYEADEFYERKSKILQHYKKELDKEGIDIKVLFQEVVSERKEEAMQPLREARFAWFEQEKVMKEKYAKIREEKLERKKRQMRR